MSGWHCFRTARRTPVVHYCPILIVALVVGPFTAPFASYDLNAAPVKVYLVQDGDRLDTSCDKHAAIIASFIPVWAFASVVMVPSLRDGLASLDAPFLRSVVLRI